MEGDYKIVDFEKWCPRCENVNTPTFALPCAECLTYPATINSSRPVKLKLTEAGAKLAGDEKLLNRSQQSGLFKELYSD